MKNDPAVAELLAAWIARLDDLHHEQRQLRSAVVAYVDGRGDNPTQLLEAIQALRSDSDSLFRSLIWLIGHGRTAAH